MFSAQYQESEQSFENVRWEAESLSEKWVL